LTPILFSSSRLDFRQFSVNDAEEFYLLNSDPIVMKYTGDLPFASIDASKKFLEEYDPYSSTDFGRWTVLLKNTNTVLGWCGLKRLNDTEVDLGYRYHQKYWNEGFATEAAIKCIEQGFSRYHLDEIIGRTAIENKASIRVLQKAGMTFYKKAPCEGIEDSVYYKITRKQFFDHA